MTSTVDLPKRVLPIAAICGVIGLAATGVAAVFDPVHTLPGYLLAFVYWSGVSLGALGLLLLQYVTGGEWGRVIRRIMEAAGLNLIFMALCSIPILLSLNRLYIWTVHPALHINTIYLNTSFFALRMAIYFIVWLALIGMLRRWSLLRDRGSYLGKGPERVGAIGLVLFVLTVTGASIDWIMSLEPDWYSTIFGVLVMVAQGLSALSVAIVVLNVAVPAENVAESVFQDLGNLMLMFVLLWGYMAFSQYLIVWSGNLPDETAWYLHRRVGAWPWIAGALILFHFAVPFFLLLFRSVKRKGRRLLAVAGVILVVHYVDCYWLIMPAFRPEGPAPLWQDFASLAGIGGIWVAALCYWLQHAPIFAADSRLLPTSAPVSAGGSR